MKIVRLLFLWLWRIFLILAVSILISYSLAQQGILEWPVIIKVQGHSMEPTLKDGDRLLFFRFFPNRSVHRGDIVAFTNEKTKDDAGRQVGYVKRVIALPGEEVMLRDGFIAINDKVLEEPYIKAKKSTYSESFTPECRKIRVPKDNYFVLGDNRMSSKDSRDFGFVKKTDIFAIRYYNGSFSFSELEIKLSAKEIIEALNRKRAQQGLALLKENELLDRAARLRAEAIAAYNDWTEGAKKSNFTYLDAIRRVGYSNVLYAEIFDGGYLNTQDLINTWDHNEKVKALYLDARFEDIGAAVVMGKFGDCQVSVVSVILGGYEPPNYSRELIVSWERTLTNLRQIQPSWEALKKNTKIYLEKKAEIDRICAIIALRIYRISRILSKLKSNQYLNEEEQRWLKEDKALAQEQSSLAEEINRYLSSPY